jgi:hypothetical protein
MAQSQAQREQNDNRNKGVHSADSGGDSIRNLPLLVYEQDSQEVIKNETTTRLPASSEMGTHHAVPGTGHSPDNRSHQYGGVTNAENSNSGRDSNSRDPAVLATTKGAINEEIEQGDVDDRSPAGSGNHRRDSGSGQPRSAGVVGGEDAISARLVEQRRAADFDAGLTVPGNQKAQNENDGNKSDSTVTAPEVTTQQQLINGLAVRWTKKTGQPPYPKMHCVHPHGGHTKTDTFGWQIMRRAKCQYCDSTDYIRLVAGYVSAKAMKGLERETLETQKGIVRNILRRRAGDVDQRLLDLRCTRCSTVGQGDCV